MQQKLNNDSCDKSDGECGNCAPGWEGHLCNKGKNKQNMKLNLNGVLNLFAITFLKKVDYKSFEREREKKQNKKQNSAKKFFVFLVFVNLFDICIK